MSRLQGIVARVRDVVRRRAAARRAVEEFRFHLEMETEKNVRLGMSPVEARRHALTAFGGVEHHRETMRDERAGWLDDLGRDIRLAWRSLRRTPGFAIAAVSSLALGFALAASVVAIVNAYLIRSMPYPAADRLYHVRYAPPGPMEPNGMQSIDWSTLGDVVEAAVTSSGDDYYLNGAGGARTVNGVRVSPGYQSGLGLRVVMGRPLVGDDFATGAPDVALISHALWRDWFGSDSAAVGRELRVEAERRPGNVETLRVVGVIAPGFWAGRSSRVVPAIVRPLRTQARTYMVLLREGVSPAQAERRMTAVARAVGTWFPPNWPGVQLESLYERYTGGVRPTLVAIGVAAGLVLTITCVNVGVLLLLRTMRRQRDAAVRIVLGAGRLALLRMHLIEIGVICAAAAMIAVALTMGTLRLLAPAIEEQLGTPAPGGTEAISVNSTVLAAVGALGVLAVLMLALIPMLMPWERRLAETLRRAGRGETDGRALRHARSTLIALEIGGSLALLVGCGLMIRSAVALIDTDLGFRTEQLLRTRVALRAASYPDAQAFQTFYQTLIDRVSSRGISAPVFSSWPPFIEAPAQSIERDLVAGSVLRTGFMAVGAGYFDNLGIAQRQGRAFTADDRLESEPVAIVSETLARRLWPGTSPIGRRIRNFDRVDPGAPVPPWRTVVGVVADVKQTYEDRELGDIYIPYFQNNPGRFGSFYLRTREPTESMTRTLRAIVSEIDPRAVLNDLRPIAEEDRQLSSARFMTSTLTGLAIFTAVLAMLGIYGVVAYTVQQRSKEVAIRMAIGATAPAVIGLFVRDGGRVLAVGIVLGLAGSVGVARVLEHRLFGVAPFDAWTLATASAVMVIAGLAATWWPARRAAHMNPVVCLNDS